MLKEGQIYKAKEDLITSNNIFLKKNKEYELFYSDNLNNYYFIDETIAKFLVFESSINRWFELIKGSGNIVYKVTYNDSDYEYLSEPNKTIYTYSLERARGIESISKMCIIEAVEVEDTPNK